MKAFLTACLSAWAFGSAILPSSAAAEDDTFTVEGVAVIAAGSINPPNPVDGCNRAKTDATAKAANAGFKGGARWEHLSNDSDCKLQTQGATGVGYFYIFTAKGSFKK